MQLKHLCAIIFIMSIRIGLSFRSVGCGRNIRNRIFTTYIPFHARQKISHVLAAEPNEISDYTPLHRVDGPHLNRAVIWVDEKNNRYNSIAANTPPDSFKIVSYNVLGPLHGESIKHKYAAVSITKWTRRREILCEHLLELQADIYCLQEITSRSIKETFAPKLRRLGVGLAGFAPARRHGNQHHGQSNFGHKYIGTGIFCNTDKFDILESRRILLRDFMDSLFWNMNQNASDDSESSLKAFASDCRGKFNSMMLTRLRLKSTGEEVVIANAHLFWDPAKTDVKVMQTQAAIRAIEAFIAKQNMDLAATGHEHTKYGTSDSKDEEEDNVDEEENEERARNDDEDAFDGPVHPVPPIAPISEPSLNTESVDIQSIMKNTHIIFCGDLNSDMWVRQTESNDENKGTSNDTIELEQATEKTTLIRTGIADLLTKGEVPTSHPHHPNQWRNRIMTNPKEQSSLNLPPLRQPVSLKNIYEMPSFQGMQPQFTTKTDGFEGWIDHIWCTPNVDVQMVLKVPVTTSDSVNLSTTFPAMPNKVFPSDHLPIGCVVQLRPQKL